MGGKVLLLLICIGKIISGKPIIVTDVAARRDYVHIDDVVSLPSIGKYT